MKFKVEMIIKDGEDFLITEEKVKVYIRNILDEGNFKIYEIKVEKVEDDE
jgi:DNA/RNA endonuclease G (NUC1)